MATPTLTARLLHSTNVVHTTQADSFELVRAQVERDFILLSEGEILRLSAILQSEEAPQQQKEQAILALLRHGAPIALRTAVAEAYLFGSFEESWTAAQVSLWKVLNRYNAKKGLKLSKFITLMLPIELQRERKEIELLSPSNWQEISVKAALGEILETGYNRLYLTAYSDCQGMVATRQKKTELTFPWFTTVTRMKTVKGCLITLRIPETVEKQIYADGKRQIVEGGVVNPMLEWLTFPPHLPKVFSKAKNWPRKTKRAKTGFKLEEFVHAQAEIKSSLIQHPKLAAHVMKKFVFARPPRPIRREDVSARMVQDMMRHNRFLRCQVLDEKAWSVTKIGTIMDNMTAVSSYDAVIVDDEGDEVRYSAFLSAPSKVLDEEVSTVDFGTVTESEEEDIFSAFELSDAEHIVQRLQTSGLWEIAMQIPLSKFLQAYVAGRPGFCTLCSRYGVRIKFAIQIMQTVQALLSQEAIDEHGERQVRIRNARRAQLKSV